MHALIKIFKTTSFRDGGSGSLFLKSCLEELELFVHTPPLGDHRLQVQAHDSRLGNGKLPSCHGFAGTRGNRARKSNPCLAGRGEHRSVIRGRTLCFLASHWPLLACLRLRRGDGSCPGQWQSLIAFRARRGARAGGRCRSVPSMMPSMLHGTTQAHVNQNQRESPRSIRGVFCSQRGRSVRT